MTGASGQAAAQYAKKYWTALVNVAQLPDMQKQIPEIAAEAGVSEDGIERRLKAICFYLEQKVQPEEIAAWGQSKTMSMHKKARSVQRGEGKPAKRFCLELPEDLHAQLCEQRERLGRMGICMGMYFHAHLTGLTDVELYHEAGLSK